MKGARAKRAAEDAAAVEAGKDIEPKPPAEAREGGPRPGPVVKSSSSSGERVLIPAVDFSKLIAQLRTSELLGAAAADAFEAAAGLRPVATPQSKGAKDLRSEVAESREADGSSGATPKKKARGSCMFSDGPVDEVPDLPPEAAAPDEADAGEDAAEKEAPPELSLSPKQNKMRTDLEMWVMDEVPATFGVDDSEELQESLQEDGQADQITFLIAETNEEQQQSLCTKWLQDPEKTPEADALEAFVTELLAKVRAIQALSPKKKKKKKKAADGEAAPAG